MYIIVNRDLKIYTDNRLSDVADFERLSKINHFYNLTQTRQFKISNSVINSQIDNWHKVIAILIINAKLLKHYTNHSQAYKALKEDFVGMLLQVAYESLENATTNLNKRAASTLIYHWVAWTGPKSGHANMYLIHREYDGERLARIDEHKNRLKQVTNEYLNILKITNMLAINLRLPLIKRSANCDVIKIYLTKYAQVNKTKKTPLTKVYRFYTTQLRKLLAARHRYETCKSQCFVAIKTIDTNRINDISDIMYIKNIDNGDYIEHTVDTSDEINKIVVELIKSIKNDRNRDIVISYFSNPNITLNEIGEQYGLSRERIRQIIHIELTRLKVLLETKYEY